MKKRVLALMVVLAMVLSLMPTGVLAADNASGQCGENAVWDYDSATKTLTISGSGEMRDLFYGAEEYYAMWYDFIDEVERIVVEDGITHIGSTAFRYMKNVKTVQLPKSVVSVGSSAFGVVDDYGYPGTTWFKALRDQGGDVIVNGILLYTPQTGNVVVPNTVKSVAGGAIADATSVTFPSSVERICEGAVSESDNPDLKSVTVQNPDCVFEKINYDYWGDTPFDDADVSKFPSTIGTSFSWGDSGVHFWALSDVTVYGYADSTAKAYCDEVNAYNDWTTFDDGYKPLKPNWSFVALKEPEPTVGNFTDVPASEYYADPVAWAVENNITTGTSDTTFSPDDNCTRGQIVTFLWRAYGEPTASITNPFNDVNPGDYYYDAVLWAVEKGITTGTNAAGTTFSPDASCTRAQAMTFQYRAAGEPAVSGSTGFTDVPTGEYYTNAVAWAVSKGITTGATSTTFNPNGTCTRGQIVTFLYRELGKS